MIGIKIYMSCRHWPLYDIKLNEYLSCVKKWKVSVKVMFLTNNNRWTTFLVDIIGYIKNNTNDTKKIWFAILHEKETPTPCVKK